MANQFLLEKTDFIRVNTLDLSFCDFASTSSFKFHNRIALPDS